MKNGKPNCWIECAQPGYENRLPKWRRSYSEDPDTWDPRERANKNYYRLKKQGKAWIAYFRESAKTVDLTKG